jgi:uncharacterized protein YciI
MMARAAIVAVLTLGVAMAPGRAEGQVEAPDQNMKAFQLVFLKEEWVETPAPEEQLRRVKTAHEHFRKTLLDSGAALISGPIADAEELREVAVTALDSLEQAIEVFGNSPAARVAQQRIYAYTWWAAGDILRKAPDPTKRVDCYLGLLKRKYPIQHFPQEEMRQIQEGHLANIKKMADSGDLVIAGPVEDEEEDLRGILIFRTRDPERIRALVAEDPAVQKGRLVLELYRWSVPDGTFPPVEPSS